MLPLTLIGVLIHEAITNPHFFPIMVDEEVFHLVRDLGEKNGTQDAAEELVLYIRKSGEMCKEDYEKTSRDLRYSSGKIEKVIFKLLAKVVNKQNKNGNAQKASRIMFLLGYRSYLERSNRFRQKMENLLKAERMKQKKDLRRSKRKIRIRNQVRRAIADANLSFLFSRRRIRNPILKREMTLYLQLNHLYYLLIPLFSQLSLPLPLTCLFLHPSLVRILLLV